MIDPSEYPLGIDYFPPISSTFPKTLSATCSELTITIRDSEKTQKTKHLVYVNYYLNPDDPVIKAIISQALVEFNAEPESVKIRVNLEVL